MRATDILEITAMTICPGQVFYPMHACTSLSIHKIISYSLLHGTGLYTRQSTILSYRQYSMNPERRGERGSALQFALGFRQSIFFPSHTHTLSVILTLTVFISQSFPLPPPTPLLSLSLYIRPSSFIPLALMLMHSQSGCPLNGRALHVHQAVKRPACK